MTGTFSVLIACVPIRFAPLLTYALMSAESLAATWWCVFAIIIFLTLLIALHKMSAFVVLCVTAAGHTFEVVVTKIIEELLSKETLVWVITLVVTATEGGRYTIVIRLTRLEFRLDVKGLIEWDESDFLIIKLGGTRGQKEEKTGEEEEVRLHLKYYKINLIKSSYVIYSYYPRLRI